MIPFPFFICIERWYSINEKIESSPIFYNRQKAKLYNSYASFGQYDEIIRELLEEAEWEEAEEEKKERRAIPRSRRDCGRAHKRTGGETGWTKSTRRFPRKPN